MTLASSPHPGLQHDTRVMQRFSSFFFTSFLNKRAASPQKDSEKGLLDGVQTLHFFRAKPKDGEEVYSLKTTQV